MRIGTRQIGDGARCFVIAEAGVNHNGNPDLARRLIDVAAEAGADAVKFQTFNADRLAAPTARKVAYQTASGGAEETQHAMLKRLELGLDEHTSLKAHAEAQGLVFMSTPFDEESADFLADLGITVFKLPSGEITNLPFIAHVARKGVPVVMSTGTARLGGVDAAVKAFRDTGASELAVLHCVSCYPAAAADVNLRAMATMAAAFGVPVGYSDHTIGTAVALASVALGAAVLEKHFTLDRAMSGPDHATSLEPGELKGLMRDLREVESALGHGRKEPAAAEAEIAKALHKSLHLRRDVSSGERIGAEDLIALRPAGGIAPTDTGLVIGAVALRDLEAGARLEMRNLSFDA